MTRNSSLVGKVAIVTGGGGGIGVAISTALAEAGVKVVIADINESRGLALVEQLKAHKYQCHFVKTDTTSSQSVQHLVEETVRVFGSLDIAVNNAAARPDSSKISELDEGTWTNIISNNLSSVAYCLKWQLQQMIKQGRGGSIINMSSIVAVKPVPQLPSYIAAKQGVIGLTQVAALENGAHGIRVNAIAPGAVQTTMLDESLAAMGLNAETYGKDTYLLQRVAQPEEIGEAVLWFASEKSGFVTGTVLPVDGGFAIM